MEKFNQNSLNSESQMIAQENELLFNKLLSLQEELFRLKYGGKHVIYTEKHPHVSQDINWVNSAELHIKNQLTYRLGAVLISNSKSIIGIFAIPYLINNEIKNFKRNKTKNKTPALINKKEVDRYKGHLSYRLGEILVNNHKTFFGLVFIPFLIIKVIVNFKLDKSRRG